MAGQHNRLSRWHNRLFPSRLEEQRVSAKKFLAYTARFPQNEPVDSPGIRFAFASDMKAKIIITPKKAVLDPQGKTVQNALAQMGYPGIGAVHVGKYLEIEVTGDTETVRKQIDEACHKFLSNPVIEDYKLEIE